MIGFTNTSYIVDETVGMLQVDVQVFTPPDDQFLPTTVSLVVQTVSGSVSKYTELLKMSVLDIIC